MERTEPDDIIRCRVNIDPLVHGELAAHLRGIKRGKWGDRLMQLAIIGLVLQQSRIDGSGSTTSTPGNQATATHTKDTQISRILGSPNEFAQSLASLEFD